MCACAIQVQRLLYCSKSTVDSPQAFTADLVASAALSIVESIASFTAESVDSSDTACTTLARHA